MARHHNMSHFFKYMSAETALNVISRQSLRWSTPLKFNDPFDHQIEFKFDFCGEDLAQAIYREIEQIVFDGKDKFKSPSPLTRFALSLQSVADRLPKDDFKRKLREKTREITDNFHSYIANLHAII